MATTKRTDQEILQRIAAVKDVDVFGFKIEVLLRHLSFEAAKPLIRDEITESDWASIQAATGTPAEAGASYLPFAVGKIEDERGISAGRSVQKFAEWAWLDGKDELAAQIDDEGNYGWYGEKAVRLYAEHYGLTWTREGEQA